MLKPWPTCLPHSDPQAKARRLDFTYWGLYPSPRDGEPVRGIVAAVLFCVYKAPSVGSLCSIGCTDPEHTGWKTHPEGSWEHTSARHERCQTSHHDVHGASAGHRGGLWGHGGSILPALGVTAPSRWYSGSVCVRARMCICLLEYKISLEGYTRAW